MTSARRSPTPARQPVRAHRGRRRPGRDRDGRSTTRRARSGRSAARRSAWRAGWSRRDAPTRSSRPARPARLSPERSSRPDGSAASHVPRSPSSCRSRTPPTVLLDAGANADVRPEHLAGFALLGSTFARIRLGLDEPRVGLLSVGEEPGKGNELAKAAYPLLEASGLNFIGNVEGRDIPTDRVDVVVTDGFTGNVVLKLLEGFGKFLFDAAPDDLLDDPGGEGRCEGRDARPDGAWRPR